MKSRETQLHACFNCDMITVTDKKINKQGGGVGDAQNIIDQWER